VSLKDLESRNYTHCRLLSRLLGKHLPLIVPALATIDVFNIIANEEPTWLFYSDTSYLLHLSPLPASTLAMAVKTCSQSGSQAMPRQKAMYLSKIIDHFLSERNKFILTSRASSSATSQNSIC